MRVEAWHHWPPYCRDEKRFFLSMEITGDDRQVERVGPYNPIISSYWCLYA